MIHSTKIKAIQNLQIKEGGKDNRTIPEGLFKPHMTFMLSGKTGSGKSTALINMLKQYFDGGVFQKLVVISPTVQFDEKYRTLPITEQHENYSNELIGTIMQQQKDDMDSYRRVEAEIKLYKKFQNSTDNTKFTKDELLTLYSMLNPVTGEIDEPVQEYDKLPYMAVVLDDLGGTKAFQNGNNALNSIVCKSRHYCSNFFICVQHPYQCPRALRSQCSHVVMFQTKDKKLLEEMARENCSHLSPDEFVQMFGFATQNPHDFMLCDFKSNEVRRNFDEILNL
jgi:energy-coupling factor transporter ATP-binding protein EcfA2